MGDENVRCLQVVWARHEWGQQKFSQWGYILTNTVLPHSVQISVQTGSIGIAFQKHQQLALKFSTKQCHIFSNYRVDALYVKATKNLFIFYWGKKGAKLWAQEVIRRVYRGLRPGRGCPAL